MAIIFGSGEPVSRLRRGLDVKGKVNLGLDEIVVPMALVSDFTAAPYRRSPVRWWANANVAGGAGLFTRAQLANTSGRDQLIDRIYYRTDAVAALNVGSGLGMAPGAGTPARTTELVSVPPNATGDISRALPIEVLGSTITPTSLFDIFLSCPGSDSLIGQVIPVEIVLPAAPRPELPAANVTTLTAELTVQNVIMDITFSGLYFDQLPLDSRT